MKSLLNVDFITKTAKAVKNRKGETVTIQVYPEVGMADVIARWLIEVSSGRQNKYVVCRDWEATRNRDYSERSINDLSPDAQEWCFTMALLVSATKGNAVIPSRDGDEQTLAKDYSIPSAAKLKALITYSHRVGFNELLGEKEKFVVHTGVKIKYDADMIVSPAACEAFIKEHGKSGDKIETAGYVNGNVLSLSDIGGIFTDETSETFESMLKDDATIKVELAQILKLYNTSFKGYGRVQEPHKEEVLTRWLARE